MDLQIPLGQAESLISVFATGMVLGVPSMALLAMRISKRLTLVLALILFVAGHVVVALASDFTVLLGARFVTAVATAAFWAVSAVATVLGVPVGAFVAQIVGWRGTFWFLAVAATMAAVLVPRLVPAEGRNRQVTPLRAQFAVLRSGRLWLALLSCATPNGCSPHWRTPHFVSG
jgi:DHA1 family inner membrane transport protein